jgi:hypothetical protein
MWMKLPGWLVALGIVLFICLIMSVAVLGGTKADCSPVPWYRLPACSMAALRKPVGRVDSGGRGVICWFAGLERSSGAG